MTSLNIAEYFQESIAVIDPVERAQAVGDFCCDAENLAAEGRTATAIEMFKMLLTIDRYDDLLTPYVQIAEQQLRNLGARKPQDIDAVVSQLTSQFQHLDEYKQSIAVAKSLHRDMPNNAKAVAQARQLLATAEAIRPLSRKDLRFKAMLESQKET